MEAASSQRRSHGWLDSLAISLSMLCAVHCLVTPILIVALPIVATSFWVHENFHLWMVLFVVPTTTVAIFMGCREHKDKAVLILGMAGLAFLVSIAAYETVFQAAAAAPASAHCDQCATSGEGSLVNAGVLGNLAGGLLLVSAHVRNFLLCRRANCTHES